MIVEVVKDTGRRNALILNLSFFLSVCLSVCFSLSLFVY